MIKTDKLRTTELKRSKDVFLKVDLHHIYVSQPGDLSKLPREPQDDFKLFKIRQRDRALKPGYMR